MSHSHSGFTLMELIAVVTVIGILAAIAMPSLSQFVQSNSLTTTTNEFIADVKTARSEAIKRGITAIVCESTTGTGCTTTGSWNGGWMVFSDTDGSGTWNQTATREDVLIRYHPALITTQSFTAAPATAVSFNQQGVVVPGFGNGAYIICNSKARKNRTITISTTGNISVREGSCS